MGRDGLPSRCRTGSRGEILREWPRLDSLSKGIDREPQRSKLSGRLARMGFPTLGVRKPCSSQVSNMAGLRRFRCDNHFFFSGETVAQSTEPLKQIVGNWKKKRIGAK